MENAVPVLKSKMEGEPSKNRPRLKEHMEEAWKSVRKEGCNRLVMSHGC